MITRIIILQHYAFWHCLWYVHLPTITSQPREKLHSNYTIHALERALCHPSVPHQIKPFPDPQAEGQECTFGRKFYYNPQFAERHTYTVGAQERITELLTTLVSTVLHLIEGEKNHSNTKQLNFVVEPLLRVQHPSCA